MRGREIHCYIVVNGMGNQGDCVGYGGGNVNGTYLENAVMDMYAKCGSLKDAKMVFNKMKDRGVASWNIMIMGYGMHSYGDEAIDVFQHMLSDTVLKPDEVTFVNVLSACSHAGLVHKGREILKLMESEYNVTPTVEHFACVVDMLGRAGYLSEAFQLAKSTPFERNPVIWSAVLAACRLHGNASLAEIAARMLVEIEPEHSGSYVLISNVYGSIGRYEDVSDLRKTMRTQNVRKTPGCSWIELMNGLHVFVNGDQNHPECAHIYARLGLLTSHLHEYDYTIDFSHL
ncbi:hypothetical protein Syun_003473 [Stephania yunnanensis]|uniref:Pentatricopeptide repeat-containing protein n=1 Tax=Stephania yunnanensis TaxID=152371 RepID=A0AAP0L1H6_9MAGN